MREIEMKLKLDKGYSYDQLKKKLKPLLVGEVDEKRQIDTVFLPNDHGDGETAIGTKILRIREVLDVASGHKHKSLMTLKVKQAELAADEYEFMVGDASAAEQMIVALGWKEYVTVDKKRFEAKTSQYNICLDEVARLGVFIELEKLTEDDENIEDVQREMKRFLRDLDLPGEIWSTPYDTSLKRLESHT